MANGNALLDAKRLIQYISKNKSTLSPLLILTHNYPDPDALGSAFALQYIFKKGFGIKSEIVYKGEIGRMENKAMVKILKIPIRKLRTTDLEKFHHVALVDTQPAFENNPFPKNRQATIVVDQHSSSEKTFSQLSIINTQCGATSVILAQALLQLKLRISPELATALVYGILSDTLNLFRSNQPEVLRTYLKIIPYCDLRALSKIQNPVRTKETYTTLGKGIQNAAVMDRLIVSHLGKIKSPDLISQVADFLVRYENMLWCLCTGRFSGKLYFSLRLTNRDENAAKILRSILDDPGQAGGHGTIAGGSIVVGLRMSSKKCRAIQKSLVDKLVKQLKINKTTKFAYPFKWGQN